MAIKQRKGAVQPQRCDVKTGDTVQVITGKDRGKVGEIVQTLTKLGKVIVKGVNIKTKHVKPQQEGESGRIVTMEALIIAPTLCPPSKNVVSRICYTFNDEGRKVRMLKKTGEIIDMGRSDT